MNGTQRCCTQGQTVTPTDLVVSLFLSQQPQLRLPHPERQHGLGVGEDLIGLALHRPLHLDPRRACLPPRARLQLNAERTLAHMPTLLAG